MHCRTTQEKGQERCRIVKRKRGRKGHESIEKGMGGEETSLSRLLHQSFCLLRQPLCSSLPSLSVSRSCLRSRAPSLRRLFTHVLPPASISSSTSKDDAAVCCGLCSYCVVRWLNGNGGGGQGKCMSEADSHITFSSSSVPGISLLLLTFSLNFASRQKVRAHHRAQRRAFIDQVLVCECL